VAYIKSQDLMINLADGRCADVPFLPSPHCDARPKGCEPDLIVVHGISLPPGEFGGPWIDDLFMGRLNPAAHPYFAEIAHLRVSAHLLIRRDGGVTQYVPFHLRAWHAGVSSFAGRAGCNDFSIGIELEGTDDTPYSAAQYTSLVRVIAALREAYSSLCAIAGHADIAPGRKTDPWASFDWGMLAAELAQHDDAWLPVSRSTGRQFTDQLAAEARLVIMTA
jgi:AmpD protein